MTFSDWMATGLTEGWVSEPCCWAHDGLPLTDEEQDEMEAGGDPCVTIVRVWPA